MLITNDLPLSGENLLFCEKTRDRVNADPDRRAEVITEDGKCWVTEHSIPIGEGKPWDEGKRIVGWWPPKEKDGVHDGGSVETQG